MLDAAPPALLRVKWVKPICIWVCIVWDHMPGGGGNCLISRKICSSGADLTHPCYHDFPGELGPPPKRPCHPTDQHSTKASDLLRRGLLERDPALPQTPTVSPRSHAVSTPSSGPPLQ
jgi:hypothetical protein